MTSRAGLKRIGMRMWRVAGPVKNMLIEKETPNLWFVWPEGQPRVPGGFMVMEFARLGDARTWAEYRAGIIPYFLRRQA